jgi:uncharacterized protein (TIGR00725 family)
MPSITKLPEKPEGYTNGNNLDPDRVINRITFFGDSAIPEDDPIYKSVYEASKLLAQEGFVIVNGGGPGLMKAATDGAEDVNGKTVAVYWEPKMASFFEGKNLANVADDTFAQSNYVMRTFGLIEKGDAYVVCKGGTGTMSEFGLVWCLAKLYFGVHKPVILYGDFWQELIESIQKGMYIDEKELGVLYYATTPEDIVNILHLHESKLDRAKLKEIDGDEAGFILQVHKKVIVDTYNRIAQNYHSYNAGKLVAQKQLDEFVKLVNAPAQVLDIGCGPGYDAKFLSEKYSVTALEISKRMVEIAQFENPNVDVVYADIVDYELGNNVYKGIWARDSIHHIKDEDLPKVFQKISDALVEGGIFYAIVREGEGELSELEKKTYGEVERYYNFFTADELVDRAEQAGFELVKLDHVQRSHKWIAGVFKKKEKNSI